MQCWIRVVCFGEVVARQFIGSDAPFDAVSELFCFSDHFTPLFEQFSEAAKDCELPLFVLLGSADVMSVGGVGGDGVQWIGRRRNSNETASNSKRCKC